MKYDFAERQYVQIVKEKFSRLMNQIPFVSDVEIVDIKSENEFADFRATVNYTDCEKSQVYYITVKSNGEKRFAKQFIEKALQQSNDACCLFAAPYISQATSELFKESGFSFMDLSGNCYISTRNVFINVSGNANQYIEKRPQKNYFSKTSTAVSVILRTMLNQPQKYWKVKELSQISGKALGTVSNVKAFLTERDFIDEVNGEFRIKNIQELLLTWSKDYHKKSSIQQQYYTLDSVPEIEAKISDWSETHDRDAVLSGFSAAARYAPTVRYNKVNVYVENQSIYEFVKDLDLKPVQSGGNVVVTIPHDNTPCMFCDEINDCVVASPVQTVLDLLGMPNRGEEAAQAIISKKFGR